MKPNRVRIDAARSGAPGRALVPLLRRRAHRYLRALGLSGCELSVAVVRDAEIRALNRRWRKRDQPTDVLSFPQELPLLGDVVISVDTARRQARALGRTVAQEAERYLAHGVLHLLGHDHHRPQERRAMAQEEERLLRRGGMLSG